MTRSEILKIAKPILFNTDMVRAILDGRKTVTRRVIKLKYGNTHHEMFTNKYGTRLIEIQDDVEGQTFGKREDGTTWRKLRGYIEPKPPYRKGDYLYVRETGQILSMKAVGRKVKMLFPADDKVIEFSVSNSEYKRLLKYEMQNNLLSPYWLTKEEARIFLRVTSTRVERLKDMAHDGPMKEGIHFCKCPDGFTWKQQTDMKNCYNSPMGAMKGLWNSTIPKKDLDKYGWDANPCVWVIEFERVKVE